jgi:hypothetical protein
MSAIAPSDAALALLRQLMETRRSVVTDANREAYRELTRAGIMEPITGFARGREANFRFTEAGWEWINGPADPFSSLAGTPAIRR